MKILVTGGAGFVGSHTCKALAQEGYTPITFDNLSRGFAHSVKWGPLVEGDIRDRQLLRATLRQFDIEAVIHFAAFAYVGESVQAPDLYFDNNVRGSASLIEEVANAGVKRFIFSSTCSLYAPPSTSAANPLLSESDPVAPMNPYAKTKWLVEEMLKDRAKIATGFSSIALRYFNAAGSDLDGEIGENHDPETHLIPLALRKLLGREQDSELKIFGNDYPTPDGTCVRDYIHVTDLARAHVMALKRMTSETREHFEIFNLGTGQGTSVLEILNAIETQTCKKLETSVVERRAGDPPFLVANNQKSKSQLGWLPQYSDLKTIIETSWQWLKK